MKFIFPLLCLSAILYAGDVDEEVFVEEHASVRSRELNFRKRDYMQDLRAEQREEEEKQSDRQKLTRCAINQSRRSEHTPFSYTLTSLTSYPVNSHWLVSIADNDQSLEMEDGSHWEISSADTYTLRTWRREDTLAITPNYQWFNAYDYYITNKTRGNYIKVNLAIGPLEYGPNSHWIVNIDYFTGHVYLENQMVWCVQRDDLEVLRDWIINDHVILGQNDSWFSSYDHILINVAMDDHIRVKQY